MKRLMFTIAAGGFCDQSTHREDDNRRGAAIDAAAQRDEVPLSTGAAQVVPEPASWSQTIIHVSEIHVEYMRLELLTQSPLQGYDTQR